MSQKVYTIAIFPLSLTELDHLPDNCILGKRERPENSQAVEDRV